MRILRMIAAFLHGMPFRRKEFYNYQLMGSPRADVLGYCRCCTLDGRYIPCPDLGGLLTYVKNGKAYTYRIVDFQNDDPTKDWYHYGDHINPVIEFVKRGGAR